ncbi:MAG TPA: hypothetical protein VFL86_07250 [Burkholderiaceae bacterium]|nr:hypothetical protein [Burkholderiaceae bacterium]
MNRISQRQLDRLTPEVQPVLAQIASAAVARGACLVSGLAEGADRHLARLALDAGYTLHALLPFQRDTYAADFESDASRAEFTQLLARATHVTELPGRRGFAAQAYRRAGHALLDQADVLLAVWDGQPAQGAGGTAEVVNEACRRRIPVVHLSTNPLEPTTLLWQRQGRAARGRSAYEAAASRRCGPAQVAAMLSHVMRAG